MIATCVAFLGKRLSLKERLVMAKRKMQLDKDIEIAITIVELPRWRDRIARILLALVGLRHVLFISAKDPIQYVKYEPKPEPKPKPKRKPKKAV